jgi:hypothetical protein
MMPWRITRQTDWLVRRASAVILYTWFIICFFISIGHRPVFSEGKAPTETFNKLSEFDHKPEIAEHPWIERALALGFSEQFGFSSLPIRALARDATHSGAKRLIVLIESDGAPWQAAGYRPPSNPTPKAPISLQMALHTPTGDQLLYLGRPCQFIGSAHQFFKTCEDARWWTSWRFPPKVVKAYQEAILSYQAHHNVERLVLAGFSGGGSLAAQIATGVKQIDRFSAICLITIASPLDLNAWAKHHRLSFFKDVVDVDLLKQTLVDIPSAFAFSDADRKVPIESAGALLRDSRLVDKVHHYIGLKHNDDWVDHWPELLRKAC